ncbi:MAG TPA: hypothetical protein VLM79_00360, partial [Kofleriaceae bacterium]|nr:hypothetical protein [Kofleriaceae bacterium]
MTGARVTGCCEAGGLTGAVVPAGGLLVVELVEFAGAGATGPVVPGTTTVPGCDGCAGCACGAAGVVVGA